MRILYLSLTPSMRLDDVAGYATHMREVCRALVEAGHELVISVGDVGRLTARGETLEDGGVRPAVAPATSVKDVLPGGIRHLLRDLRELDLDRRSHANLRALCEAERIDAVYERAGMMQLAGLATAAVRGLPHVLEINTPIEERRDHHGFPLYRVGVRRQRRQLVLADQISCVSTVLSRYLVERGAAPDRTEVIPNAVRLDPYAIDDRRRRELRAALGVGEETVALGFVGRFGFWHGMLPLVEALAEVLRAEPRTQAVLIGDGQLMPDVRRFIATSGLDDRFTLTGAIDWRDVPERVAALDVGIMASSNWYGSPLKIFEYGAGGVCIVGPRVEPVTEVMRDGEDGVLVTPGDADELERVLLGLVREPERRATLAARFHTRVREEYTWSRVAERIRALFERSPRRAGGGA